MAKKTTTVFVCNSCGYESSKWLGKCPACNEWNTFIEEKAITGTKGTTKEKNKPKGEIVKLNEVEKKTTTRIATGVAELDRVLGGGFVNGSLTLLGGEPGIGKSTLILQICDNVKDISIISNTVEDTVRISLKIGTYENTTTYALESRLEIKQDANQNGGFIEI